MPNKPPAFRFYAKDWLVDTTGLSLQEQGAYMRLLSHAWIEGPLPADHRQLARRVGVTVKHFAKLWPTLKGFWRTDGDGRLVNERLEMERQKQVTYREQQAAKGRKSRPEKQATAEPEPNRGLTAAEPSTPEGSVEPARMSSLSFSSASPGTTSEPTVPAKPPGPSPNGVVAGLIRKHCYPPDGEPPTGHDIARDIRWWNVRSAKYRDSVGRLEMALRGAPLVWEALRGVKWSPAKVFTKQGEWADLFERSVTEMGKQRTGRKAPQLLADIMRGPAA